MPAFEKKQTDDPQRQQTPARRYLENFTLFDAGFKRIESSSLWEKNGGHYHGESALQKAWGGRRVRCTS